MKLSFLDEFNKQFPDVDRKAWTGEERLEKLGIDFECKRIIEKLEFKKIDVNNEEYCFTSHSIILVSDVIGINRPDNVENWIECLFNLHKKRNFDLFQSKEIFEKFLVAGDDDCEDLPHVIEEDGKYFIAGSGKHRITFAKCLGIKNIFVCISKKV